MNFILDVLYTALTDALSGLLTLILQMWLGLSGG
jgi:hypothetical protein